MFAVTGDVAGDSIAAAMQNRKFRGRSLGH
jgi:hypothetical protein